MRKELLIDIRESVRIIKETLQDENRNLDCTKYARCYGFTTANNHYYEQMGSDFTNMLSVCGGNDYLLNGILFGSQSITTFDINRLQKYPLSLKLASLHLNEEDLLNFWFGKNPLDQNQYNLFAHFLQEEEKTYWDFLYSKFTAEQIRKGLFRGEFANSNTIAQTKNEALKLNPYLVPTAYKKLQKKVKHTHIEFIEGDIKEIPKLVIKNKKFNIVNLSNICDLFYQDVDIYKEVIQDYMQLLKNHGQMMMAYIYKFSTQKMEMLEQLQAYFPFSQFELSLLKGKGQISALQKDALLTRNIERYHFVQSLGMREAKYINIPTAGYGEGFDKNDMAIVYQKAK